MPDAPAPTVSVVICAYTEGRWAALADAVASARSQEPTPLEVLVVVDHNPALLERARDGLRGTRVIPNEEARGLSGARNTGARHAQGVVVAFLDDDARAQAGWLAELQRAFADRAVVGAGGVAEPRWEKGRPAWFPAEFLWVVGCSYRGLPEHEAEIRNPIGANMAFRRYVLDLVGGFTDGIGRIGTTPLGCEETELAIRARAATDARIVHLPGARVEHLVASERVTWRYFRRRCWAEGRSKALISRLVGAGSALASERSYVARTLPAGVRRGLTEALRGEWSGLARAAAIVAGLLITSMGYLRERLAFAR